MFSLLVSASWANERRTHHHQTPTKNSPILKVVSSELSRETCQGKTKQGL
jgi:hypothetical protein